MRLQEYLAARRMAVASSLRRKKWLARSALAAVIVAVPAGSALALSGASGDTSSNSQPKIQQLELHTANSSLQASDKSSSNNNDNNNANADSNIDASLKSNVSSSSVEQHTTVSSSSNGPTSSAQVTVNGQNVPVPKNGSLSKTITNNSGGTSHVEVHSSNQGTASNSSTTNFSVNVTNDSSTEGN